MLERHDPLDQRGIVLLLERLRIADRAVAMGLDHLE